MFILSLIFSVFVSAEVPQNKADIFEATGLTEIFIISETEKDLEHFLACSGSGYSNGLEEFYVDGYTTPTTSLDTQNFKVVTGVTGPSGASCYGKDTYMCYTTWTSDSGSWAVLGTECIR